MTHDINTPPPQKLGANELQVGGTHYKRFTIQPWDFIKVNNLDFFQGSVIAYVCRYKHKGGVEDLRKAIHYLNKMIENYPKEPPHDLPRTTIQS